MRRTSLTLAAAAVAIALTVTGCSSSTPPEQPDTTSTQPSAASESSVSAETSNPAPEAEAAAGSTRLEFDGWAVTVTALLGDREDASRAAKNTEPPADADGTLVELQYVLERTADTVGSAVQIGVGFPQAMVVLDSAGNPWSGAYATTPDTSDIAPAATMEVSYFNFAATSSVDGGGQLEAIFYTTDPSQEYQEESITLTVQ